MSRALEGKTAIVTGAGSGIGQAVAVRFANEGARVVLSGRTESKLRETAALLDGSSLIVVGDLVHAAETQRVVEKTTAHWGAPDILVNSAGAWQSSPLLAHDSVDVLDHMIAVNLRATFLMCRAVAQAMQTHGGVIVNVSSAAGVQGLAGSSAYAASKGAVIQLTRSLAAELAPQHIRVNCVAPGNVATPINAVIRTPAYKAVYDKLRELTPTGRAYMDPDEMAGVVLFLASDLSRPLVGAVIVADEGVTAALPSLKE